jgi:hypothetical protein
MNVFVFLGPTLPVADARAHLDATYLPPAEQGSVYRAAEERPFAILVVDGFFERVPAVWHKEILWAISKGIHVFGASSMGALRAAELAPYGMVGVGAIYEGFASGALEDDDEVAVAHGDGASGWRPSSEALVNVRATLERALAAGAIGDGTRHRLEAMAKGLFYPDRTYGRLFARALEEGSEASEIARLRAFVETKRVDQKREDAVAALAAVRRCREAGQPPPTPAFYFAHTQAWSELVEWASGQPRLSSPGDVAPEHVAAEVRLAGPEGRALIDAALSRAAAAELARVHGVRRAADQGSELQWMRSRLVGQVERRLLDELGDHGDAEHFVRRARQKQETLVRHGLDEPTLDDARLTSEDLLAWYFTRLGVAREARESGAVEGHALRLGLPSKLALEREALRELLYERLSARTGEA